MFACVALVSPLPLSSPEGNDGRSRESRRTNNIDKPVSAFNACGWQKPPMKIWLVSLTLLLLAAVLFIGWSYARFSRAITTDIRRLIATAARNQVVVTPDMVSALPAPARRYFEHSGVVGKPIPRLVRLRQVGRIRANPTDKWMELEAEEFYSTSPPAFVWRAYFPKARLPIVLGRDEYLDGAGSIVMKMLAVYPVANERGQELGPAGLMRYLNEMAWFPAAFLGENVTIEPVDEACFRVTIADRGMTATALLFVDESGRLTNFRAQRFHTGTRTMETWETPMAKHGVLEGLRLPIAGAAVWKLKNGDFPYIELDVTDVKYDEDLRL